jgi:hypothetical protein
LSTYGYFYSPGTSLGTGIILGGAEIPLTNDGVVVGLTHIAPSPDVIVNATGDYEIEFLVSTTVGVNATFAIAVNSVIQTEINYTALVALGQVKGQGILSLEAGDSISIVNNSLISATLSLSSAVSVSLLVKMV